LARRWLEIERFRQAAVAPMWWAAGLALYTGQRQADVLDMAGQASTPT
jgi:hypothetical protein